MIRSALILTLTASLLLSVFSTAAAELTYTPNQVPLRLDRANTSIGFVDVPKGKSPIELRFRLSDPNKLVVSVSLYPAKAVKTAKQPLARVEQPDGQFVLRSSALVSGTRLAVTVRLRSNASLLDRFTLQYLAKGAGGAEAGAITYRPAVKVRDRGDDNSLGYRIPGLVTTKVGTLLACYDVRYEGMRDLQGHMDIGISRSTDGGQNWEPMRIALDMGEYGGLPQKFNGVSDANLLVDAQTGRIFCFGLWMHGVTNKDGEWLGAKGWIHQWHSGGSNPGFAIKGTSQFLVSHSDDDGQTWSQPKNLTRMVKRQEQWHLYAPAPGNGITLRDGTLVVPTQGKDEKGRPFSTIMTSKDRGKTWRTGLPANDRDAGFSANECAVVELPDGALMLNARDPSRKKFRGVFITRDRGESWTRHATSNKALIEPTCMASLIQLTNDDRRLLLFSNPNTKTRRTMMTVKASLDNGDTWPAKAQVLLDQRGGAYSSLSRVDANSVGILYESSQAMLIYQRLHIEEILGETP